MIIRDIFIVLVIGVIGYQVWDKKVIENNDLKDEKTSSLIEPLYEKPYVVVYGRNTCGYTNQMRNVLDQNNIPYEYVIIDDREVADEIHTRMTKGGLDIGYYLLPVVDVNARIYIRPQPETILEKYKTG